MFFCKFFFLYYLHNSFVWNKVTYLLDFFFDFYWTMPGMWIIIYNLHDNINAVPSPEKKLVRLLKIALLRPYFI